MSRRTKATIAIIVIVAVEVGLDVTKHVLYGIVFIVGAVGALAVAAWAKNEE
jgi:hypothetical protein